MYQRAGEKQKYIYCGFAVFLVVVMTVLLRTTIPTGEV
jgi:hypothetical protein